MLFQGSTEAKKQENQTQLGLITVLLIKYNVDICGIYCVERTRASMQHFFPAALLFLKNIQTRPRIKKQALIIRGGKGARELPLFVKQTLVLFRVSSNSRGNTKSLLGDLRLCILSPSLKIKALTPSLAFRINCTVILKLIPNCFTTHREKRATQLLFCFHLTEGDIMQMIFST